MTKIKCALGWAWSLLAAVLALGALIGGMVIPALLLLVSALLVLPLRQAIDFFEGIALTSRPRVIGAVVAALVGFGWLGATSPEAVARREAQQKVAAAEAKREAEAEAAKKREAAKKEADEKRKGFHCLSPWDGSNRDLVNQVKRQLREPSSFEHAETRIAPADAKGKHPIVMEYRARNGFGGMNIGHAIGVVDSETCAAVLVSAE